MRHMKSQYSPILLLRNSPITSTPHSHSKIPGGFHSYHVQRSITCLQWCTQSSLRGNVCFHPSERIHHLEAMGGILHMAANPIIYRVSQGPRSIPPYFCITDMDRNPNCRRTPHSKQTWRITSALWGKYSRQWGPQNPDSTQWEALTLVCY